MLNKKWIALPALAVAAATLQGCAGFRSNNLPQLTAAQLHFSVAQKTRIYSKWDFTSANGAAIPDNARVANAALAKKAFEDAINTSGCCVTVDSQDQADVVVNGTSINEANPAAMVGALITGLSLYTIPSWVTLTVHVQATAKKGSKSGNYDLSDSSVMVQWLPMLFVFPFSGPFETGKEVSANTYNSLVLKMHDDGMFN